MTTNKLKVFACGGAGINIASFMEGLSTSNLFAAYDICYIDTSHSNLKGERNITDENSFLFDGLDGSGKIRASNASVITNNVLAILQKFQPEELNIVIHSTSGGSGSVIGPAIVSELKNKGKDVVVLMVGSTDSIIETENTYKTFETYDSISRMRKSSTLLQYISNDVKGRAHSDKEVMYTITALLALYSGCHSELDSADLRSWINQATESVAIPTIATLSILSDVNELAKLDKIVSVATLATPAMTTKIDLPIQYQCVGYVPNAMIAGAEGSVYVIDKYPLNYVISFDALKNDYKKLKEMNEKNKEHLRSLTQANSGFDPSGDVQENGLVL